MKLIELETCKSTNDEAWKHLPGPAIVVAKHQSHGRGRQSREWVSGSNSGNIFTSLLIPSQMITLENLTWIPLAAGIAALEAIKGRAELRPNNKLISQLRLKWPNDLYFSDSKLGGILCESKIIGNQLIGVVVGCGINTVEAPELAGIKTASIQQIIADYDPVLENSLLIHHWANQLLFWVCEIAEKRTQLLCQRWNEMARLHDFPDLTVHDKFGKLQTLNTICLTSDGRLQTHDPNTGQTLYLTQADTV